jgi:hypothetical protein
MDVFTGFTWVVVLFEDYFKYGGYVKFWGYVETNAAPRCVVLYNFVGVIS